MIKGMVKGILLRALNNFAKQGGVNTSEVQLYYQMDENSPSEVRFTKMVKGSEKESISFLDIINKRFDLLGQEETAKPYMAKSITAFAKELSEETKDICVLIYSSNSSASKTTDVKAYLVLKGKLIRSIDFEEIFEQA